MENEDLKQQIQAYSEESGKGTSTEVNRHHGRFLPSHVEYMTKTEFTKYTLNTTIALSNLSSALASTTQKTQTLQTQLTTASNNLAALTTRLACVSTSSTATDIFIHCNAHIRNGMGATSTVNGKGNLILGYNEGGGSKTGYVTTTDGTRSAVDPLNLIPCFIAQIPQSRDWRLARVHLVWRCHRR